MLCQPLITASYEMNNFITAVKGGEHQREQGEPIEESYVLKR